jgi:beta-1,4-mannosyl-glycoprotein beta-1,4-N-acetylglucosaminyltransferase
MIYDCFNFFDELDLLEIRFNILSPVVDRFIVVESNQTFNGKEKPLFFNENRDRFKEWEDKIIHYITTDFHTNEHIYQKALASPNTGPNKEHYWVREFYQKEELIIPLLPICNDDDIICVSDVDEIWNPKISFEGLDFNGKVYKPILEGRALWVDVPTTQHFSDWTGTRIGQFKILNQFGPNHFRTERECPSIAMLGESEPAGWHFSWLIKHADKWGDSHPDNIGRFNRAKNHIEINSSDVISTDFSRLPQYLKDNKQKWINLFYDKF